MNKKIFVFLFDGFSDWEIAFLTPEIQKSTTFDLVYFSIDGGSVSSMGGLSIAPNLSLEEVDVNTIDLLILPGGTAWEENKNTEIESLVTSLFDSKKSIAAICAATTYLGKLGFLDHLKHTSNDLNYLKGIAPQYLGETHYVQSLATTDQNIITANGIAPIEFSKEIFAKLKLYDSKTIEKWFQLFKNGIWVG